MGLGWACSFCPKVTLTQVLVVRVVCVHSF